MKHIAWYVALVVLMQASAVRAENWPQWRGPRNNGVSAETNLPSKWSATENLVWKARLPGRGGATPCIWGNRIFIASTVDQSPDLLAMCFDTDGKELWRRTIGQGTVTGRGDEADAASPSPSTDGKHVWFLFGPGDFVCLDFDGNEIWKFKLQSRYGKLDWDFGMHSTPVLHEGRLYLQLLRRSGQDVVCLDAATGKEIWKVNRPSDGRSECLHSYASAFVWSNGDKSYLVTHGNDYTVAHDLKDGKELWRLGGLNPKERYNPTLRFVASPVCTPDLIVVPSAKRGVVVGVKPTAQGRFEAGSPHEQWRLSSGTPDVPSPLVVDGLVYLCGESGSLTCLDAQTGKVLYSKTPRSFNHRASPVFADGKVFITARDGMVHVIKAGRDYELIAANTFNDPQTASPAIANGRIYLRGFSHLYAIGK